MRHAVLVAFGILAIAACSFFVHPGHTWLQDESLALLPGVERLDSPGLLSRDLVATHPNVTYTIYDEATLSLRRLGHLPLRIATAVQAGLCRIAGVTGCYLLLRVLLLSRSLALLFSFLLAVAGRILPVSDTFALDLDPTPHSFAFGLTVFASGLLARGWSRLAGLAGGLAFVYDARIALPFWIAIIVAAIFDRATRPLLRAPLIIFGVSILLLANLAQLQPSPIASPELFDQLAPTIARIVRFRSPSLFVSDWPATRIALYFCIAILGLLAVQSLWKGINRQTRWLLLSVPVLAILSIPASTLLLDVARISLFLHLRLTDWLGYLVLLACVGCAGAIVPMLSYRRLRAGLLASAFLLAAFLEVWTHPPHESASPSPTLLSLSSWAERNTWGGSMFLFPDAGTSNGPGAFRVLAQRAVWVDWQTGIQGRYSSSFADEWWRRWMDTMQGPLTADRLQNMLSLPIDYFVLQQENAIADVPPAFATDEFLVYDADSLRSMGGTLRFRNRA
jgi:hypothetical protein